MLQIEQLHQYYGGSHILRGVDLEARQGEITVVLGRNGVGKTTLMKSLMGLVPTRSGQIGFDGKAIGKTTPYERARAGIGFVPQGREIFARLTVHENLLMGLATKNAGTPIPTKLLPRKFVLNGSICAMSGSRLSSNHFAKRKTLL